MNEKIPKKLVAKAIPVLLFNEHTPGIGNWFFKNINEADPVLGPDVVIDSTLKSTLYTIADESSANKSG